MHLSRKLKTKQLFEFTMLMGVFLPVLGVRQAWVQVLAPLLSGCVTLGKLLPTL